MRDGVRPNSFLKFSIFDRRNFSDTALNLAAHRQKYSIVELLLEYRANPNIANQAGKTALHRAVASYNDENAKQIRSLLLVKILLFFFSRSKRLTRKMF